MEFVSAPVHGKALRKLATTHTNAEVRALFDYLACHAVAMVPYYALQYFNGLRPEEVRNLGAGDVDLNSRRIHVPAEASKE